MQQVLKGECKEGKYGSENEMQDQLHTCRCDFQFKNKIAKSFFHLNIHLLITKSAKKH